MKTQSTYILILTFCFVTFFFSSKADIQIIDHADTVVLDMSQAIITGNTIDIPVTFHSDDTIYALDFSFKYNHATLIFDSVITVAPYISSFYYYNPADSVLRFTSNSLHQYAIDSPMVVIRFTILNPATLSSDIYEMYSYLNGDTCSTKYTPYLPLEVYEQERNFRFFVFPNPSSGYLRVSGAKNSILIISELSGKELGRCFINTNSEEIDLSHLKNGLYFLRSAGNTEKSSVTKILIQQ